MSAFALLRRSKSLDICPKHADIPAVRCDRTRRLQGLPTRAAIAGPEY